MDDRRANDSGNINNDLRTVSLQSANIKKERKNILILQPRMELVSSECAALAGRRPGTSGGGLLCML